MADETFETNITVEYEEDEDSPQESYSSDGFKATRTLLCAWADRHTLANQLIGGEQEVGGDIITILPAQYPHGMLYARVSNVEIAGEGVPEDENSDELFEKARLTVSYKIFTVDTVTLVEESIEPACEFLTLPVNGLYWGTGANKVALTETEAPGAMIHMFDWVYKKNMLSPPTWLGDIEGYVNSVAMRSASLNRTFPPETLLVGKPELSRTKTNRGTTKWAVTIRFTYRSIGWNLFPRTNAATPSGISFEPITNGVEAIRIFPACNFSDIVE